MGACAGKCTWLLHAMSTAVRNIQRRNEVELELAIDGSGSWHDEYRDSAYVFVGGLPFDLTEGDVITIFSQYGEVVDINLPRAREEPRDGERKGRTIAGRHRGFGFLMYDDQRSTVLAVDNLNGAQVLGRTLRVDHVAGYKHRTKNEEGKWVAPEHPTYNCAPPEIIEDDEEEEDIDLSDPMAAYFAEKKREKRNDRRSDRHHSSHRDDRHRSDCHSSGHRSSHRSEHRSDRHRHSHRSHRHRSEQRSDRDPEHHRDVTRSPRSPARDYSERPSDAARTHDY